MVFNTDIYVWPGVRCKCAYMYLWVCMHTCSVCSLALSSERVWEQQYSSNNEHISSQLLISIYHSQKKKKAGLGRVQNERGTSCDMEGQY